MSNPIDSFVMHKEPEKNAVIVELTEDKNTVVHIECKDNDVLWLLREIAKDIKQSGCA